MPHPADQTPWRQPILKMHQAVFPCPAGGFMPPISGVLKPGSRVCVQVESLATWRTLRQALLGQIHPRHGWVREAGGLRVQSDAHLYGRALRSKTAYDWLSSWTGGWVWFSGRRRSPHGVLDMLGISAKEARRPWRMLSPTQQRRVVSLQLLCSPARLILIERMLSWQEPSILKTLALRWGEFVGAVLALGDMPTMPGSCNAHIQCLPQRIVWHNSPSPGYIQPRGAPD